MAGKINRIISRLLIVFLISCCLLFFLEAIYLAFYKFFTIDEFQYAHAAWLCAQGMIPYRDFFDHHFPFIYQLFSVAFIFNNNPLNILYLRGAMLFFLLFDLWAIAIINRKVSKNYLSSLWAILFLLCCWPFITRVIEIRPDCIAFSFFMISLALLYLKKTKINVPPLRPVIYHFSAGLAMGLAIWSSQKVMVYGLPLFFFVLADLICYHHPKWKCKLTVNPYSFLSGLLIIILVISGYLLYTSSYRGFWQWCIIFPMEMQRGFKGFFWGKTFFPGIAWYFWLIPLFLFGWMFSLFKLKKSFSSFGFLLLFLPFSTFLSYSIQVAPYDYSLIPFYCFFVLFSGRGAGIIFDKLMVESKGPNFIKLPSMAIFCLFLVIGISLTTPFFFRYNEDHNLYQLRVLKKIDQVTAPDETFFDNTGNFITRPHAYYFYYNCQYMRDNWSKKYSLEIPQAIKDNECAWIFMDYRMSEMPKNVIAFILNNYVRFSPDLWVWGKKIKGDGKFDAVKDGKYFIYPEDIIEKAKVKIDGKLIKTPIFYLNKGIYEIVSSEALINFYIIYLPADGKTFRPNKAEKTSTFVR